MGKAGIYARLSLADEKSTSTRRQEKECSDPEHQATAATATLELLETSGLGYTDANLAATALTMEVAVCSFDRGLDRITGLRRNEPV